MIPPSELRTEIWLPLPTDGSHHDLRVLIVGNSGSGKTTLARTLVARDGLAHLDLDSLAWLPTTPPTRRPLDESVATIRAFTAIHAAWVIEGCYADLATAIGDQATELVFLNPGVEACVRRCLARPWEHRLQRAARRRIATWSFSWRGCAPTRSR